MSNHLIFDNWIIRDAMISGVFDSVVVIGCGKIAVTALKYVAGLREHYGFKLRFIQHEIQELTAVRKVCEEWNIDFQSLPEKQEMTEELMKIQESALIISAGNHYLFPKALLEHANISVINFHNALLPKYPGRNAPSWAIYCEETISGATWHQVTEEVDGGGIIWQGSCEITPDMKAYELTARIMELAQEGLEFFLEKILQNGVLSQKQEPVSNRVMYYAKDIPSQGRVTAKDTPEHIYRTLRALDYGKMGPFPALKMELVSGKWVEIVRYKKVLKESGKVIGTADNYLEIPYDSEFILILKYKEI